VYLHSPGFSHDRKCTCRDFGSHLVKTEKVAFHFSNHPILAIRAMIRAFSKSRTAILRFR
jgi:hypothetical protein